MECKTLLIYVCSKGREWPSRKKLVACLERASADSFTKIHRCKFFSEFIILINAYLTTGKKFRENKFTIVGRTLFPLHRFLWIKYLPWNDSTAFLRSRENNGWTDHVKEDIVHFLYFTYISCFFYDLRNMKKNVLYICIDQNIVCTQQFKIVGYGHF